MKTPFVRDLVPNEVSTGVFLVQSKEVRQKRTGESYLSLIMADRTGELEAKMWDNVADVIETFDRDDFIKVRGLMQVYNNRPQFVIHKLRPVPEKEVEFGDFFPASERDPEEMWRELRGMVGGLDNPHIQALLNAFLDDPQIAERYKIAPAAKSIHHAFRSGLLDATDILRGVEGITFVHFDERDVVRHSLVQRIVRAYEKYNEGIAGRQLSLKLVEPQSPEIPTTETSKPASPVAAANEIRPTGNLPS